MTMQEWIISYLLLLDGGKCCGEKYGLEQREGKAHKEGYEHQSTTCELLGVLPKSLLIFRASPCTSFFIVIAYVAWKETEVPKL